MTISSEIKEYLASEAQKAKTCCGAAFDSGKILGKFEPLCSSCTKFYLSGVFCAFGSLTDPKRAFHLEFSVPKGEASALDELLRSEGLVPKRLSGRKKDRLYYKDSVKIEDCLTFIGAARFSLEIMKLKVIKELRSSENRIANAECANLDRAATAAADQLRAIKFLRARGKLSSLPDGLVTTARLREENPSASLEELRQLFLPPISKSGLNHRLSRILEEAEKAKDKI